MTSDEFDAAFQEVHARLKKDAIKHGAKPDTPDRGRGQVFSASDNLAVEDVLQQTMCNAQAALASFKGDSSFYTWLVSILRNTIRDVITAEKSRRSERKLARLVARAVNHPAGRRVAPNRNLSELAGEVDWTEGEITVPLTDRPVSVTSFIGRGAIWYASTAPDVEYEEDTLAESSAEQHILERRLRAVEATVADRPFDDPVTHVVTRRLRKRIDAAMSAVGVPAAIQAAMWRHAEGSSWGELAPELRLDRKALEYQARVYSAAMRPLLCSLLTKEGSVED